MYKRPDITGANPDYKKTDDFYRITRTGMRIRFDVPIFAESLVIVSNDDPTVPWLLDTDYEFTTDDYDDTSIARASNAVVSFDKLLVRSVTIKRTTGFPDLVNMSYQQFYLTTPQVPIQNTPDTIDFTPDLVADMLGDLATLKQQVVKITDRTANTIDLPKLLDYDINGTSANNLVTGEEWTVDTFNNKNIIFPVQGAFFKDSVQVFKDGVALTYGTDYLIQGVNFALTRVTTNTSGIFTIIQITSPYAGKLTINYRAVGGQVTTDVISDLYTNIQAMKDYLGTATFVTADNLSRTTAMQNVTNAIKELQNEMRIQLSGKPTYGDTTNGQAINKAIIANNTNLHWWTIASLYKVDGSVQVNRHDRFSFHLESKVLNYMADIDVAFDMDQPKHPLTVSARNVVQDPGFTLFGDVNLTTLSVPMIRVIYNSDTNTQAGALLQIGLSCPGLTDTLTIENRSGVESTWQMNLDTGSVTALSPADDKVTLPDGVSVWSASGGLSQVAAQTVPNNDGYLVFAGSQDLSTLDDTSPANIQPLNCSLPTYFRYQDIKFLRVYLVDRNNQIVIARVPVTSLLATARTSGLVAVNLSTTENNPGMLSIGLNTSGSWDLEVRFFGKALLSDMLSLRYVIAEI